MWDRDAVWKGAEIFAMLAGIFLVIPSLFLNYALTTYNAVGSVGEAVRLAYELNTIDTNTAKIFVFEFLNTESSLLHALSQSSTAVSGIMWLGLAWAVLAVVFYI